MLGRSIILIIDRVSKSQKCWFLNLLECSLLPKKISVHHLTVINAIYLNPYFDIPLDLLNNISMVDIDQMIFFFFVGT